MTQFVKFVDVQGKQQRLPVPQGADPGAVVDTFQAGAQRRLDASITAELPTLGEEATGRSLEDVIEARDAPLIGAGDPQTIPEDISRGIGLGARTVASAIPRAGAAVADIGASILNLIPRGVEAATGIPQPGRLPTGASAQLEEMLNQIFPEPVGGEAFIDEAGNLALTGVGGGAALTGRVGKLLATPGTKSLGTNILDDIGAFFAKNPRLAVAGEVGGGVGAVTAAELSERADLSPIARAFNTIVGGVAGGIAPTAGLQGARRGAQAIAENILPFTQPGAELRAARRVKGAAGDVETSVARLQEGPVEGVLPARAIEDPGLQRLEARVLADDPKLSVKAAADLEVVEKAVLTKLADDFGPGTDKTKWQQEVILQGTPKDAEITIGQPDEMIAQAGRAFDEAYDAAKGFPIQTQNIQVEGGNVSIRQMLAKAIEDPDVFTTPEIQARVTNRIEARLIKLERVSPGVEGAPGVSQVNSDEILTLRQAMRAKERSLRKAGATGNNPDAIEEADLLNNVSKVLTDVLESQLPAEASAALRLSDVAYGQFKIVQGAINRSGTAGLTPEALRAQVKATGSSAAQFARGETGALGRLAEVGRDPSKVLGKPDEAARLTRNATPEELKRIQSDISTAIQNKSQSTFDKVKKLDGKKLLAEIDAQRETLKAAKFSDAQINGMEQIGRELKIVQARSADAVETLLNDNVGNIARLLGAIAGSKGATRILRLFGTAAGAGPNLILAQFGSRIMRDRLKGLSVDTADRLLRGAFAGDTVIIDGVEKSVLEALLTKPTATLRKQAQAARTMGAFLLELEPLAEDEEE